VTKADELLRILSMRSITETQTPPHGTSDPERIESQCMEKGMRMTDQRRVIARVLSLASDHPDVEEVHHRAAEIDNKISIATVYRTVRLFEEAGILERHDFLDGRSRYEQVTDDHHDHLIDLNTGKVIEFHNDEIEKLQRLIASELGFNLVGHRLELYGVSPDRDKKARKN
jgi:Fur family ferric uptake transcriptional regulator